MTKNNVSLQRREREREEMQEKILRAAMKLFLSEGYEGVTIRRLADEISYTPGAIYSYFQDKEEICFTLHERAFNKLIEQMLPIMHVGDPRERLLAMGRLYIRFALEHKELYDLMFIMSAPIAKMIESRWDCGTRAFELLLHTVEECITAGYFSGDDARVIAFAYWAFVHGCVSLLVRERVIMIPPEEREYVLHSAYEWMMSWVMQQQPSKKTHRVTL